MKAILETGYISSRSHQVEAFDELERGVHAALETYSNVHRGSGHYSLASTYMYEQARDIILEYLGLGKDKYIVIFCSPLRAEALKKRLGKGNFKSVSSRDIGIPLGVIALAVNRRALPEGTPFQTGGGTIKLVSPGWAIWADAPDRFEAGTPAIINVITFARALKLIRHYGNDAFCEAADEMLSACEILYHDDLEKYSGRELLDELRLKLIGRDVRVPTVAGDRPCINLDNGATTPTFTPVWDAVRRTWRQHVKVQHEIIHEVRSICAEVLDAPHADYDVIFTSNTTEAINLAAESMGRESGQDIEPVVLNTFLEHHSNELPWRMIPGISLVRLSVDVEGFINLDEMEKLLCAYNLKAQHGKKRIRLVAVNGASNVLGTFNDLAEISRITHRYGSQLLVDAAQLIAHRKLDVQELGIDYLAFSAHKIYAPFGIGALVVRKGLLNFSSAELKLIQSSGEENTVGIAALGKALVLLQRIGLDLVREEERTLTAQVLRGLAQIPGIVIYGVKDPDSPGFNRKGGVIVFSLHNVPHNVVSGELSGFGGIGVRNGCHCAHLLVKRMLNISPLRARLADLGMMLFPRFTSKVLPGVVRISLGIENDEEDVKTLIQVLDEIARRNRTLVNRILASSHNGTPILPETEVRQQMKHFAFAAARRVYNYHPQ